MPRPFEKTEVQITTIQYSDDIVSKSHSPRIAKNAICFKTNVNVGEADYLVANSGKESLKTG